jgi:hypothetical protein
MLARSQIEGDVRHSDAAQRYAERNQRCSHALTARAAGTPINPADGAVRLSLWVKFGSVNDKIVLRGLALNLAKTTKKAPNKDEDDQ